MIFFKQGSFDIRFGLFEAVGARQLKRRCLPILQREGHLVWRFLVGIGEAEGKSFKDSRMGS